jgi:hypothetical protein
LFRWKWLVKTRENEDTKKGGEVWETKDTKVRENKDTKEMVRARLPDGCIRNSTRRKIMNSVDGDYKKLLTWSRNFDNFVAKGKMQCWQGILTRLVTTDLQKG